MAQEDTDLVNDMSWEDQENYRAGQGGSIKEIALEALRECQKEGRKEMTRGGIIRRVVNGQVYDFPKPDQIHIFANCVEMLMILLRPYSEQHIDVMKTYYLNFYQGKKDIKVIRDSKRRELLQDITPGRAFNQSDRAQSVNAQITAIDAQLNEWYDQEYLRLHKDMLQGLSVLLNRMNYFQEADYSDDYDEVKDKMAGHLLDESELMPK